MLNYQILTDKELLRMIVMEKDSGTIADTLINQYESLSDLVVDSDEAELIRIKGLGPKRAQQIKAINELTKRLYTTSNNKSYRITGPKDVANLMIPEMKFLRKEELRVLLLNT